MAIESLMERRGAFDYILLETTGLADPGNIAPVFWVDDNLGSSIYLDGIVTLVDAKNILHLLDEPTPEETVSSHGTDSHSHSHSGPVLSMAHMQISHADVIILNKADLVTEDELARVKDRVTAINNAAKIHITDHSKTPEIEGVVLDLHAYDHLDSLDFAQKGHSHIDPVRSPHHSLPSILCAVNPDTILTPTPGHLNRGNHHPTRLIFSGLPHRHLAPICPLGLYHAPSVGSFGSHWLRDPPTKGYPGP